MKCPDVGSKDFLPVQQTFKASDGVESGNILTE